MLSNSLLHYHYHLLEDSWQEYPQIFTFITWDNFYSIGFMAIMAAR